MSDLRSQLISKGWKQGVILTPDSVDSVCSDKLEECIGYLVLTQTCDCLNDKFEKEPYLELLPLREISGSPNKQLINGRNPRVIQFVVSAEGSNKWVEASIHDIFTVDRAQHKKLVFADCSLTGSSLDGLVAWRVDRYARTPFPESFGKAFNQVSKKFGKKIKNNDVHGLVYSLLISLEPFEELSEESYYELQILIMVRPKVMANLDDVAKLKKLSDELTSILEAQEKFLLPECKVMGPNEMNLEEREGYYDFTDYDFLSFGEE